MAVEEPENVMAMPFPVDEVAADGAIARVLGVP